MTAVRSRGGDELATAACDDLLRLVGDVDERKVFDILALRPTVAEIGQAALWAGTAAERLDVLTADEEEEPPPIR